MVHDRSTRWASLFGVVLLVGLDWPPEEDGPVIEPPGPAVKLEAIKTWYPSHPGPTNPRWARCTVRVFVDETGRPYHTDSKGCMRPFDGVAEKAFKSWRFEPHVVDGVAVPAKTKIDITFILGQPGSVTPPPLPACEWWILMAPTRELTLGRAEPPGPCAGWIPDKVSADVPLEGLWGTCSLKITADAVDDSGCPLADRAVGRDIVERSLFGRASSITLVIDMPPGGTPPAP